MSGAVIRFSKMMPLAAGMESLKGMLTLGQAEPVTDPRARSRAASGSVLGARARGTRSARALRRYCRRCFRSRNGHPQHGAQDGRWPREWIRPRRGREPRTSAEDHQSGAPGERHHRSRRGANESRRTTTGSAPVQADERAGEDWLTRPTGRVDAMGKLAVLMATAFVDMIGAVMILR